MAKAGFPLQLVMLMLVIEQKQLTNKKQQFFPKIQLFHHNYNKNSKVTIEKLQ
jgi:hypothetical protein